MSNLFFEEDVSLFFTDFAQEIKTENGETFLGIFDDNLVYYNDLYKVYGSNVEFNTARNQYNLLVKNEDIKNFDIKIDDTLIINDKRYIVKFINYNNSGISAIEFLKDDGEIYVDFSDIL